MSEKYTDSANAALKEAKRAAGEFGHSYVGSEHLLIGLYREKNGTASRLLRDFQIEERKMTDLIESLVTPEGEALRNVPDGWTPRAKNILKNADAEAVSLGLPQTGTEHLLLAMLEDVECVGTRLLYTMQTDIQKMYRMLLDILDAPEERSRDLMRNVRTAGEEYAADTPFLDQFGTDMTLRARENRLDPIVGRVRETERIMQILSRKTKNNPCLIGEPGVGKTAIVEGLARRIASGNVPESLREKRLVTLDMAAMVAGSKYRGEFEERIHKVLDEVMHSSNVLLFIDELHTLIGAGGAEGALDAANIMKPFLSRGEIQVIGATTVSEYRKYVEKDAALERRFQPVMVEEPSDEETVEILKGIRPAYEEHHSVTITDEALTEAVRLSRRYINDRFLPDKAIDLMDEAAARCRLQQETAASAVTQTDEKIRELTSQLESALMHNEAEEAKALHEQLTQLREESRKEEKRRARRLNRKKASVSTQDIASVISLWTGVPVKRIAVSEGRRLLNMERELHRRVIGQDEAVQATARAIKRGRAGLKNPRRPIGSFLFLGPTGVGKTELSKALAAAVFGSEQSMIRIDMSEYMEKHSVSRLVGSPPGYVGYEEGGQLSDKVRTHPYSVILFDEIEKAHPDVFNILLQVLDEGHITDSQGRKVDFKNTILIMTSNAGAQSTQTPKLLGFGGGDDAARGYEKMKSGVMEEVRRIFRPEFLNRIDETIVFHALTKDEIRSIASLMLKELSERCREQMDITLRIRNDLRKKLEEVGYDEKYGARPLRRAIQTMVEDPLSEAILAGTIHEHDTAVVSLKDGKTQVKAETGKKTAGSGKGEA